MNKKGTDLWSLLLILFLFTASVGLLHGSKRGQSKEIFLSTGHE